MNIKNYLNKLYNILLKIENYCYIILVTVVFLLITYQYSQSTNLNATQTLSATPIDVKLEEPVQVKANGDHNTYDNIEVIVPAKEKIEEVVTNEEEVIQQEEPTETLVVTATKYTAECEGCIGITKSGHDVTNTIYYDDYRIVACDPNYIPLYTTMEIEGYERQFICLDTGSAIKGFKLDILTDTYDAAIEWGRRKVEITILSYGNG